MHLDSKSTQSLAVHADRLPQGRVRDFLPERRLKSQQTLIRLK